MMGRLLHYGGEPLDLDWSRLYDQATRLDKPTGLWVSCEGPDDWREWCQREHYGDLSHCSEITLTPDANTLTLTESGVLTLADRYPHHPRWGMTLPYPDWPTIAGRYDGILIPTYWWSCRLIDKTSWYYGWDCASGCIWNLDVIESVRAVEPAVTS